MILDADLYDIYSDLKVLAETAFPKRCSTCDKVYHNVTEFIQETQQVRKSISGLQQSYDDSDHTILELYRNCSCGSTLMNFFQDRRDLSDDGQHRRQLFNKTLKKLADKGLDEKIARAEILKLLRGESSEVLSSPQSSNKELK